MPSIHTAVSQCILTNGPHLNELYNVQASIRGLSQDVLFIVLRPKKLIVFLAIRHTLITDPEFFMNFSMDFLKSKQIM